MTWMAAEPWIKMRLQQRAVFEEGGKWKGNLRGEDVGTFNSQAEALKAYRKAAFDKFGQNAVLPNDEDIDTALASGPITLAATAEVAPQAVTQPATQPVKPTSAAPPKPEPKQAPKPAPKPTSHRR